MSAARSMYSSGCEAPVRKVKFEVMQSSANMRGNIFPLCSHFESAVTARPPCFFFAEILPPEAPRGGRRRRIDETQSAGPEGPAQLDQTPDFTMASARIGTVLAFSPAMFIRESPTM